MGDIIILNPAAKAVTTPESTVIDISRVEASTTRRKLNDGLMLPGSGESPFLATSEHAAEPIKNVEDIIRISKYLIEHKRYRDNMLFIVGINFGLRVSDLLRLKFSMLLDDNLVFRTSFPILEKKTANTRRVKKNRYITINDAVIEAVTMYLRDMNSKGITCRLDDYLFKSESNHGKNSNAAMTRVSVDRILKDIARETGITSRVSTHTLRKTFGYHQMVMSGNSPRKLLLLQKMFGHSTSAQTLDYIGITGEEIEEAYRNLNLGMLEGYTRLGVLDETAVDTNGTVITISEATA